jgi:hypothetical protein
MLALLVSASAPLSASTDTNAVKKELTVQMVSFAQTIKDLDLPALLPSTPLILPKRCFSDTPSASATATLQ